MAQNALSTKLGVAKFGVSDAGDRRKRKALLAVCGAVIGAINGLFGAGGGMLAVPVLTYVAGLSEKKAHATAIAVILPLCAVGAAVYAAKGGYDAGVLLPTVCGVLLGGAAGAAALRKLSAPVLDIIFYGLMLFAGLKMLV